MKIDEDLLYIFGIDNNGEFYLIPKFSGTASQEELNAVTKKFCLNLPEWLKEFLSIKSTVYKNEIYKEYKNSLLAKKLRERFEEKEICFILETIFSVCKYCWDGQVNCHCENDE